jgi:hypothetical protein
MMATNPNKVPIETPEQIPGEVNPDDGDQYFPGSGDDDDDAPSPDKAPSD